MEVKGDNLGRKGGGNRESPPEPEATSSWKEGNSRSDCLSKMGGGAICRCLTADQNVVCSSPLFPPLEPTVYQLTKKAFFRVLA